MKYRAKYNMAERMSSMDNPPPKQSTPRKEVLDKLIESISAQLDDGFSAADVVPIIAAAVEAVEILKVTGADKKELVVAAIDAITAKYVTDPTTASIIKLVTPPAIDAAVSLAKSEFMKKRTKKWLCCFRSQIET